jgi:hypothetical protein
VELKEEEWFKDKKWFESFYWSSQQQLTNQPTLMMPQLFGRSYQWDQNSYQQYYQYDRQNSVYYCQNQFNVTSSQQFFPQLEN